MGTCLLTPSTRLAAAQAGYPACVKRWSRSSYIMPDPPTCCNELLREASCAGCVGHVEHNSANLVGRYLGISCKHNQSPEQNRLLAGRLGGWLADWVAGQANSWGAKPVGREAGTAGSGYRSTAFKQQGAA